MVAADEVADLTKERDEARAKLATPVRLLGEMLPHEWERAERQAAFENRKIAWDARLAKDKKAILAAGFTFTVEGMNRMVDYSKMSDGEISVRLAYYLKPKYSAVINPIDKTGAQLSWNWFNTVRPLDSSRFGALKNYSMS